VPQVAIDGIRTRYEVIGNGPPLLMYSPAGFDATLDKWTTQGVYAKIKLLDHLPKKYTCIVFDRRETGQSGGRVERITWASYVAQGRGLLDHLGFEKAHLLGGCMGCCPVVAFGVAHPERVLSMILYWPVGGAKYRIGTHKRFADHLAYVDERGLAGVVELVAKEGKPFNAEPRGGPWASVIKSDPAFAETYAKLDAGKYMALVSEMCRTLFDRDTSPGAQPEDLVRCEIPALIVPGRDASHATSAARYLEECLSKSEYWDVPPEGQTEQTAPARLLGFLENVTASRSAR
jgi:pimeloyl-ACP methyl ester carboxylesterase